MKNTSSAPLIGVVADNGLHSGQPSQNVKTKYLEAVLLAGGAPIILPQGLADSAELLERVLSSVDGILLPGSASNIEPHHYNRADRGEDLGPEPYADPGRDRLAFAMIDYALEHQTPLLGICRGMQELVVRTGGALHRRLYEQNGLLEHREDETQSIEERYAKVAHGIDLCPGGVLASLFPESSHFTVNSLHGQGTARLGDSVQVECRADDGLVESISVKSHPFAVGVQWHPEWHSRDRELSRRLFDAFIDHARHYHAAKAN